jgi:molybdopterin/thiamine biosynthesis adenylyltransferase
MSTNPIQQQMIQEAMKAVAERKPGRSKLVYDKTKRTIVAVAAGVDTPRALNITADDADMFAVVTLSSEWLRGQWPQVEKDGKIAVRFSSWDDGDAFTQVDLGPLPSAAIVEGVLSLRGGTGAASGSAPTVTLAVSEPSPNDLAVFIAPNGAAYRAAAVQGGRRAQVAFADVQPELATRRSGILETTILRDKSVLCLGVGTGGAHAAIELAKCGVGHFVLVDRDRLSVGNVARHPGGISQVGRFKVHVLRDLIHDKNPDAKVQAYPIDLNFGSQERLKELIDEADVVICGTDNRPSKLMINRLCVEANVVAIYGGAFRRAYGGQVQRVHPRQSPCFECFVAAMPDTASDVEVSSAADAADIAYSDRPVAVAPGLSLDVLPIANMVTKLALMELVADKQTSLSILKKDYEAPWYLWLNKPEPGTQYASLPPLSESSDEMTINRWYGIYLDRDTACPVCGDFISTIAASYGLDPASLGTLPSAPEKG